MENSTVIIQAIVLIGGIFAGFFALIKYILGYVERISGTFASTIEKSHEVINKLSSKVEGMNDNDTAILEALKNNSEALATNGQIVSQALKIIAKQNG
jgi:predicted PurR-regulated permease PerM